MISARLVDVRVRGLPKKPMEWFVFNIDALNAVQSINT